MNFCLCGENNCLNPFTLFLQNSERCNQSASASFALFDEISQKTCAIQRQETNIYLFAYFILFGGESNCLERLVFLHHCNEDQKIDP